MTVFIGSLFDMKITTSFGVDLLRLPTPLSNISTKNL